MFTAADSRPADLISVKEAARLCGNLHLGTVHRWVQQGRLAGWRLGRRVFVSAAEARALWQRIPPRAERVKAPPSKRERRAGKSWAAGVLDRLGVR